MGKPLITVTLVLAMLVGLGGQAGAQPAQADHGTGTDAECHVYGCLYGHRGEHFGRQPGEVEYGIARERLPDGPDGRFYVSVLWPGRYDPARRTMWDEVAGCESTWRWHIDGAYDGGVQFSPSTWRAYGGGEYASVAHHATPEEQIDVAERVLHAGHGPHGPQGRGAWPHCGRGLVAP